MVRVLITRPQDEQAGLERALKAMGHEVIASPALVIENLAGPFSLPARTQAILFTSASAVRAYRAAALGTGMPALVVGDATAKAAQRIGFSQVASAKGSAADLVALVRSAVPKEGGTIVHARGIDTAGDVAGTLSGAGYAVEELVLYRAAAAGRLSADAFAALKTGQVDTVLFFSPRSAETFSRLVANEGIIDGLKTVFALCLSQAVADKLDGHGWKGVRIAAKPDQQSLLAEIGKLQA